MTLSALFEGNDNVLQALIETDRPILPWLAYRFEIHPWGAIRACMLEMIWQHRDKVTILFFISTSNDEKSEICSQSISRLHRMHGKNPRIRRF